MRGALAAITLVVAACGARRHAVRFVNAPAVWRVDDREDVAHKPASRVYMPYSYFFAGTVSRRAERALELRRDRRALGTNALDEVPDSTWFTNRIGVRDLAPDEIFRGPGGDPGAVGDPEARAPWTIHSTKTGESSIGFIATDARGEKFMLKLDRKGYPELETGAHVVTNRLLWACGYHVTEDYIIYVRPSDLVLAKDAVVKDIYGNERRLDAATVARALAQAEVEPDGRYRMLASRWVSGKPLGGHPGEGVREDDRNDRIPHQLRRDLRGSFAIFAWLDHVDVQEGNSLDSWVEDPRDHRRHYVEHYQIDFGRALGVMATMGLDPRHGHAYVVDLAEIGRQLATFGAGPRPWEGRDQPRLRGVGMFAADDYDPGAWKPDSPSYLPFLAADRYDQLWAAMIVARFSRDQIAAAVRAGRYRDPRAVAYLTDVLYERARMTAAYWFRLVPPLDRFAIDADPAGPSLCFDDVAVTTGLARAADTRYVAHLYDFGGRDLGIEVPFGAAAGGRSCTGPLLLAGDRDGYTIVRLVTARPDLHGATLVHVARDPATGAARVIGVWRP